MKAIIRKTDPDPKKEKVTLGFKPVKIKSKYTPTSVETGHPEYGKPGSGLSIQSGLDAGRARKQDIVTIKGKPYRAGVTTTERTPEKVTIGVKTDLKIPSAKNIIAAERKAVSLKTVPSTPAVKFKGTKMKRRLPRVDYLEGKGHGHNKKTEAGHGSHKRILR